MSEEREEKREPEKEQEQPPPTLGVRVWDEIATDDEVEEP